ncbi:MAG: hypothetical protein GC160_13605 [Acidobacteria bacterium]|nr:hypothetical protein [Acidobacteriota bacterium]
MRAFACEQCGLWLDFDAFGCVRCGAVYGYLPWEGRFQRLDVLEQYRRCGNADSAACNWMPEAESDFELCVACRLNRTIPNLNAPQNLVRWRRIEDAKRRMVYSLLRLGLSFETRLQNPESGLAFDFLSEEGLPEGVKTGHLRGLITLNVAEADDAARERMRTELHEPFRTLVGHFRHEVGHYFWDRLIAGTPRIEQFRASFGDEREDYGGALDRHYREGPPSDWSERFVSAYASAHAWEDWAETWAHYLHIVDALETAYSYRLEPQSREAGADRAAAVDFDPYVEDRFDDMLRAMTPLGFAVNSLNRSLGQPDLYPFCLAPAVHEKLRFIHGAVRAGAS